MRKKNTPPVAYSSYARTVLSENKSLSELIRKHAHADLHPSSTENLSPHSALITAHQMANALMNPQSSLKASISVYAELLRLHRQLSQITEETTVQRKLIRESIARLREREGVANPVQQKDLQQTIKELEKTYQNTLEIQKNLPSLEAQLEKFQARLDKLTLEFDQEWQDYRAHYLQKLQEEVNQLEIRFSEMELQDLVAAETWAQIIHRFALQNTPIPNSLNIEEPNYISYFQLKGYLAIHAALGRRMLPNQPDDVLKILKKLFKR